MFGKGSISESANMPRHPVLIGVKKLNPDIAVSWIDEKSVKITWTL
jgi:hypothetical protein